MTAFHPIPDIESISAAPREQGSAGPRLTMSFMLSDQPDRGAFSR